VPAGGASTLELDLRGSQVRPGEYRLVVPRQPSLHADTLRVEVELPTGFEPIETIETIEMMRAEGSTLVWEGPHESDREFLVRFGRSPRDAGVVARIRSLFRRTGL
jgi:hypothetical protein